ncbi:MAG: hypothetical protein JO359_02555 [Candidatus Eremiobacteraeota bacterium]|nr:hypothetical protein [Candidatus Eremiobacteraeota bacterium]
MDNYVAVVFNTEAQASDGLHALWNLDAQGDITVHGAAVIRRDSLGHIDVSTKQDDPGLRTAIGIGIGAIVGALVAGPVGATAGAKVGSAAGIGAASGAMLGGTADAVKAGEHEEAAFESGLEMRPGQSAVLAEVSEDWTTPLDTAMKRLGGTIYRRPKGDVRDDSVWGPEYGYYLYPYDYDPHYYN